MPYTDFHIENLPGSHEGQRVLAVHGDLSRATRNEFEDVVRAVDARVVIVDLSGVPYVDSDGLAAIIKAYISGANSGRRLALAGAPARLQTLFKVTRIDQAIHIYPTAQQAQEELAK